MKQNKISIVIPNWEGEQLLSKNLPQVLRVAREAEVIVVDDASTDDSVNFIKKNYPQVKLVVHQENKGFAVSCNHGVSLAQGEIVVLLNTDVAPQEGFLEPIFEDFSDHQLFAVGCGELSSGPGWAVFKKGTIELVKKERLEKKCLAFWASGGQSAFSKKKWLELGGFDGLYQPYYWEDIDLCYRAWKRGFKIVWDPRAKVHHQHQGVIKAHFSKKKIAFISERNRLLFIWKNITSPKMMLEHKIWLGKKLLTKPRFWQPFLAALVKSPKIFPRRFKEIREKKISDIEVLSQFD